MSEIDNKIENAAIKWSEEETLNKYAKRFFATDNKIKVVMENLNKLAIAGETEDTQLKAIKEIRELLGDKQQNVTNNNTQINLGDFLDNLKK